MFSAFVFKKKDSIVHKLDPRTKILITSVLSVISVLYDDAFHLSLISLLGFFIIALSKCLGELFESFKRLIFFFLILFILNFLLIGMEKATIALIRAFALVCAFSILFLTVTPDDFSQALVQMKIPYDFALMLSMAIRFIPTLEKEARNIIDAQRSRGLELEKGGLIERLKKYIPLMIPLIVSTFRRSLRVAESLESRCFGASKKRTYLYELKLKGMDYATIVIFSSLLILSIISKFGIYTF
ncbi:MAG: energy-coupling factor transporter transmembrane component T family protein [Candidatus Asgardarchaeia archaeon]